MTWLDGVHIQDDSEHSLVAFIPVYTRIIHTIAFWGSILPYGEGYPVYRRMFRNILDIHPLNIKYIYDSSTLVSRNPEVTDCPLQTGIAPSGEYESTESGPPFRAEWQMEDVGSRLCGDRVGLPFGSSPACFITTFMIDPETSASPHEKQTKMSPPFKL